MLSLGVRADPLPPAEAEGLLRQERRAALPLLGQLHVYLNPFLLLKDASSGSRFARECALAYNRAMRRILVRYLRRWALIAALLFLGMDATEAMGAHRGALIVFPA